METPPQKHPHRPLLIPGRCLQWKEKAWGTGEVFLGGGKKEKKEKEEREAAHLSLLLPGTCVPGQASKRAESRRGAIAADGHEGRQPRAHNPAAARGGGWLFRANFPAENVKTAASLEFTHL